LITRFDIEERVRQWGLREDVVEKDYALGWLLWAIGSEPELQDRWIFKGGTCLKKCYMETWRFSEDLDFTVVPDGPVDASEVERLLRAALGRARDSSGIDFLAREPAVKQRGNGEAAEGSVYYRGPRQTPGVARIKVDLSRIERLVSPPVRCEIVHSYPDELPAPATVACYAFEEVFAEKIRAMGERGRPRDLYDIVNLYRRSADRESGERIHDVLVAKCANKGLEVPTASSIRSAPTNLELRSEWESMLAHQLPALPPIESFLEELDALFDWLIARAEPARLSAISRASDDDPTWNLPQRIQTWSTPAPIETIRFAAANRVCVDLRYDDTSRLIEPYSLRRTRDGHLVLHALRADSGEHQSYRVDQIQGATVTARTFRPKYIVELTDV